MGGVNETPAIIDNHIVQQPFHRPARRPRDAIVDLLDLLGDMNMDRPGPRLAHHNTERFRRDCTQRMWRYSNLR
jgi:hypothetical protein